MLWWILSGYGKILYIYRQLFEINYSERKKDGETGIIIL